MDLGYTQFVDDIESGEFDNFLSKSNRQELNRTKDRIKELRRGGMSMRDAINQASKEAMDRRRRGDREENRIVESNPARKKNKSNPARKKMPQLFNKKYKLKGKAIRVSENDVDEDVIGKASRPMELDEGALETSVDNTPKKEGFVQKYKIPLMIGGGLAVAFVLFKKFGKK